MLTESSKPTIAKKASEVAAVMAKKVLLSLGLSKTMVREKSARPWVTANRPMKMTRSRPESSTMVRTTLALTLSPTPRRLIRATRVMKASATTRSGVEPAGQFSFRPKASRRKPAKALEAVDADVMPEHMTVKATMKVTK